MAGTIEPDFGLGLVSGSETYPVEYGILYNWYAVDDSREITSIGWHVATKDEFDTLVTYLGVVNPAGKMREVGTTYWVSPNNDATNESGFNARGAGRRNGFSGTGDFADLKQYYWIWTSTPVNSYAYSIRVLESASNVVVSEFDPLEYGMSVRLVKDSTTLTHGQTSTYTGNDGKVYRTICIDTQEWLADNLCETKYRDSGVLYGYLYNWYTVNDSRNIANTDWHMPSNTDWDTLTNYLINNGYGYEGSGTDIAKSLAYTTGWNSWATAGTVGNDQSSNNTSKFNGRPAGYRYNTGEFYNLGQYTWYWSATQFDTDEAYTRSLFYFTSTVSSNYYYKDYGHSVRLVKDSTSLSHGQTGTYTGNDGKVYRTICIGTQEWLADNLCETLYRNSDSIPEVTDNGAWDALTTGARCSYNNTESNAIFGTGNYLDDNIPEITGNTAWTELTTGALCAYNNDWNNI